MPNLGWSCGSPPPYAKELAEYWRSGYDRRKYEAHLNQFPQFTAEIDGAKMHFPARTVFGRKGSSFVTGARLARINRGVHGHDRDAHRSARPWCRSGRCLLRVRDKEFRRRESGVGRRTHIVWTYSFQLKDHEFPGYLDFLGRYLFRVGVLDRDYAAMMRGSREAGKTSAEQRSCGAAK